MATITTDTYLDGGTARTAGEAWTCNGGRLLIRTDSRWHANAPASMTGSLGSVTVSATLGGGYEIDGTAVRWLAFDTGSGVVPAIGTTVSQGGVSGYLLGVWSSLTSAPTAVGAAMPANGFLKFRSVTGGAFSAGALTGISANATGADVVGWIEVVHDEAANLTFPRLGTGFIARGDWFELGTTSGLAGDTFQVPTNGGGANTHVSGVQIETGSGTGVYEWFPCIDTTRGWSTTYVGTDARAKICQTAGGGLIRIGSDGTSNIGYVPSAGCKVRIPNIFGRTCTTAARATNSLPSTTLATRPEFTTTTAGVVNIDKMELNWYISLNGAYSVTLSNVSTECQILVRNCPTAPSIQNCCVGKYVTVAGYALDLQTNVNGGTIKDNTFLRNDVASSGYTVYLNNCAGSSGSLFSLDGNKIYAGIGGARNATGYAMYLNNCAYNEIKNLKQNNHGTYINACSNITVSSIDHCDRIVGSTNTTTGIFALSIALSKDITCDFNTTGFNVGLGGTISNVHPYGGIFYTVNNLGGIKIRNVGSKASPISSGSANLPAYIWQGAGNEVDIKVQRVYFTGSRTLPFTAPNTTKGVLVEHLYGTQSQLQTVIVLDGVYRNIGSTNTVTGQTSVYGSHWFDCFTSDTLGRVVLIFNEPTAGTTPYITTTFGTGAGFTSTGNASMPNLNDQIIIETPYFVKGHTALRNASPTLTGTNTGNFTYEYQIDTGSGWSAYKTLSGANLSGETISASTGFKLRYRITTSTASATNALTYIRIDTDSTASAQENNLYPLDTASAELEFTGLTDGTTVKLYNSAYSATLDEETLSGSTTYTYAYEWNSTDGDVTVNALIWKDDKVVIKIEGLTLGSSSQSIPITQTDDLVYGIAATNITVDFANKLFIMADANECDIQELYSLWKDEVLTGQNIQYDVAFSAIGGNTISGANSIPYYAYLTNGWKVRPKEADYTLNVTNGILLVDGGGDPFVDTLGAYTVRVNYQQPVQAITVSTGGGGGASAADVWSYTTRKLTGTKQNFDDLNDVTASAVADAVWDEAVSGHTAAGSASKLIQDTEKKVDDNQALIISM